MFAGGCQTLPGDKSIMSRSVPGSGGFAILGDLCAQGGKIGKTGFVTQFVQKIDFQVLAIKITFKIEQVDFQYGLRLCVFYRRAAPQIGYGGPGLAQSMNPGDKNAVQGRAVVFQLHVGGRKPQFLPQLVTMNYPAGN